MRKVMGYQVRRRRSVIGGLLAGALAIGLLAAAPGNGLAIPPVDPTAPTCAEGGVCATGDTGPGGGTVFFVKSTGAFAASRFFPDPNPNCSRFHFCFDNTQAVSLTGMAQAALPFAYLEVAPASGEAIRSWSGTQTVVSGAMYSAIGTGATNTTAMITTIVSDNANSSAARYARSYAGGGFTDWFLPSVDELSLVLISQASYGSQMGTFDANQWSSTDCCGGSARALDFRSGQNLYVTKNAGVIGVRPVRAFSVTVQPTTTTTSTTTTTTIAATTTTIAATTTTVALTPETVAQTPETVAQTPQTTLVSAPTTVASAPETTAATATTQPTVVPDIVALTTVPNAPTTFGLLTEQAVLQMPLESVGAPGLIGSSGEVTVLAGGLVGGGPVEVYVASEPVLLGSGNAAADGSFSMTVILPADLLGEHSLVVYQPTTGHSVRQVVQIVSPQLPQTGAASLVIEIVAVLALLAGAGCVLAARRRVTGVAIRRLDHGDDRFQHT